MDTRSRNRVWIRRYRHSFWAGELRKRWIWNRGGKRWRSRYWTVPHHTPDPSVFQCTCRTYHCPCGINQFTSWAGQLLRNIPSGRWNNNPSFHLAWERSGILRFLRKRVCQFRLSGHDCGRFESEWFWPQHMGSRWQTRYIWRRQLLVSGLCSTPGLQRRSRFACRCVILLLCRCGLQFRQTW